MEVAMSLNSLVRLPLSTSRTSHNGLLKTSLLPSQRMIQTPPLRPPRHRRLTAVQAKGKRRMTAGRQFQNPMPSLPKLEDDGNPKFLVFVRMDTVNLWYPLSVVTGGTTAKIMISAKDNFLGKYIYKDALDRNLAAVIYNDEKQIQELAKKQHPVLRDTEEFRYGYKLVENNNLKAALSASNVIQLPRKEQLRTVLDNLKDSFGEAKESFGKLWASATGQPKEKKNNKGRRKRGTQKTESLK